jgi:hypothetical protein
MKKLMPILALAFCVVASAASVHAEDSSLKATLQSRYAAMKVAMSARDDKAVAALLAPDFVSIDVFGQSEGAAQMISEVDALPKDPNKVSTTTILSTKPDGDSVVVSQRYDMKTIKVAADGSKRNVELITLSTDTWGKIGGTWLLKKTQTDQLDYYVNGVQVAHKDRPQ